MRSSRFTIQFVSVFGCAFLAACNPTARAPQPAVPAPAPAVVAAPKAGSVPAPAVVAAPEANPAEAVSADHEPAATAEPDGEAPVENEAKPDAPVPANREPEVLAAAAAAKVGDTSERDISVEDNPKLIERLEDEIRAQGLELLWEAPNWAKALGGGKRYELVYHEVGNCVGAHTWTYRRSRSGRWTQTYEEDEEEMARGASSFGVAEDVPQPAISDAKWAETEQSWARFRARSGVEECGAAWVDLNADGAPEIITGMGGSCARCTGFLVFQEIGAGAWRRICGEDNSVDTYNLTVINERRDGFYQFEEAGGAVFACVPGEE